MKTNHIAIYARVSKEEEGVQNPDNQLIPLKEWCKREGWEYDVFIEYKSGGSDRPIFQKMLHNALNHSYDGIIVWSLDRFSREGIVNTIGYIKRLRARGVCIKSYKEEWLDTKGQFADLMLAMFAWFSEFERKRISDRTKAALARLKAKGVKLGRPRKYPIGHKYQKIKAPPKNKDLLYSKKTSQ